MSIKRFPSPYDLLADLLKSCRVSSGLTQVELAERLGISQSTVSKVERGAQRLDLVELRVWLLAIGEPTLGEFTQDFDARVVASTQAQLHWKIPPA